MVNIRRLNENKGVCKIWIYLKELTLTESGFISNYLISGPRLVEFRDDKTHTEQLSYESYLRSIIADKCDIMP